MISMKFKAYYYYHIVKNWSNNHKFVISDCTHIGRMTNFIIYYNIINLFISHNISLDSKLTIKEAASLITLLMIRKAMSS